jgi:hypothetical protein
VSLASRENPLQPDFFRSGNSHVCQSLQGPFLFVFFLLCRWPPLPHSPLLRPSAPLRVPCPQGSPSPRRTAPLLRPHKTSNPTLNRTSSPTPQHGPNSCLQTRQQTSNLTPFRINTCKSVSKQTTLTPFRMNTYEKPGGGGPKSLCGNDFDLLRACPISSGHGFSHTAS